MRAPTKSRTLDDVVQEIIDEIQTDSADRSSIELSVRFTINILRELDREVPYRGSLKERISIRGKRQENDDDFDALLKKIKALENALKKVSSPARMMFFSDETELVLDKFPSVEVQERALHRLKQTRGMLAHMRMRCNFLLGERPGEHGHTKHRERRVAHEAWRLLRHHKKKPASGIYDSLYGKVARLLWEAMTGEAGKDLQRACKTALRLAREGGLDDDRRVIRQGQVPTL